MTFVLVKGNAPIGMISLKNRSEEFSDFPEDSLWMGSLHVIPEERNQGLGQALLQLAAKIGRQIGHEKMYFYTSNPTNVEWYVKRGAQVVERRSFRDHTITIMFMSLKPT